MTSSPFEKIALHRLLLAAIVALASLAGTGCAQKSPVYAWSHPSGGEYLFAFDTQECGADTDEAFFTCMQSRGYFLVDPDSGQPVAEAGEPLVLAAPGYPQAGR